jgi:membrane protease YdiL (CAAX protease family)
LTGPGGSATVRALKAVGWSVAFLLVGLLVGLPLTVGFGYLLHGAEAKQWLSQPGPLQALVQGVALVVGFGLSTWLIGIKGAKLSGADLRWTEAGRSGAGFGTGLGIGALAAGLAMALGLVTARAAWSGDDGSLLAWSGNALATAGALALPALSEEIIFRGVPLVLFAAIIGRWPAVLLTSLLFSLSHTGNPVVTSLALANIALAGVFLAMAFYAPGGIWTAWGAHLGWNVALAALGAPVSGLPFPDAPFLDYHPGGPAWLSGGNFGPEGGLLASATLVAATAAILRWSRRESR